MESHEQRSRGGGEWKRYVVGVAIVLLLILVVQNAQKVEVNFFFAETKTPLVFALLVAGGLGALIGWLAPRVRRNRPPRD